MRFARKAWPIAVLIPFSCIAITTHQPNRHISPRPLITTLSQPAVSFDTRFAPLEEPKCSAFLPPRLVAGRGAAPTKPVVIDFIVGRSGNVEKPVILEGADSGLSILHAVRGWHYTPALCDGLPIEAEGRVELGSQSRN